MGTLSIKTPTNVFSLSPNIRGNGVVAGWYNGNGGLSTDAALIAALSGAPNVLGCINACDVGLVTFRIVYTWDAGTAIFSLDGGAYVTLAALPPGFLMNVALKSTFQASTCGVVSWSKGGLATLYNTITFPTVSNGNIFDFLDLANPGIVVPGVGSYITASQFLDQSLIYEGTFETTDNCGNLVANYPAIYNFTLTGDYTTISTTWTITATNPTYVGRRITINSNQSVPGSASLEFVDRITFSYPTTDSSGNAITRKIEVYKNAAAFSVNSADDDNIDIGGGINLGGNPVRYINSPAGYFAIRPEEFVQGYGPYIIEWGMFSITIVIPYGFGTYTGAVTMAAYVNDPDVTAFSGSVPLGTLTIGYANASGIYAIVPNKGNDTLYAPARDGTTVDVTIPRPAAKTGFIGG